MSGCQPCLTEGGRLDFLRWPGPTFGLGLLRDDSRAARSFKVRFYVGKDPTFYVKSGGGAHWDRFPWYPVRENASMPDKMTWIRSSLRIHR